MAINLELIFVDDGSRDRSFAELLNKKQRPETKVIQVTVILAPSVPEKAGDRYVTGDCFCTLAADLQDPPELIEQMLDRWLDGSKFVVCVRSRRNDPISTRLFASIYTRWCTYLYLGIILRVGLTLRLWTSLFSRT